jgi:hypothetical protein
VSLVRNIIARVECMADDLPLRWGRICSVSKIFAHRLAT